MFYFQLIMRGNNTAGGLRGLDTPTHTPPSNVPFHKVKTVWGRGEPVLVACTKVVVVERRRRRAGERSHGSTRPARLKIRPSDNGTMHASILAFISSHTHPLPTLSSNPSLFINIISFLVSNKKFPFLSRTVLFTFFHICIYGIHMHHLLSFFIKIPFFVYGIILSISYPYQFQNSFLILYCMVYFFPSLYAYSFQFHKPPSSFLFIRYFTLIFFLML